MYFVCFITNTNCISFYLIIYISMYITMTLIRHPFLYKRVIKLPKVLSNFPKFFIVAIYVFNLNFNIPNKLF